MSTRALKEGGSNAYAGIRVRQEGSLNNVTNGAFRMKVIPSAVWCMIIGVLLGNSGLGGEGYLSLVPWLKATGTLAYMKVFGLVGLIVFVYAIGAHLDVSQVRCDLKCRKFLTVTIGGLLLPGLVGAAFGWFLYPYLGEMKVSQATFAAVNAIIFPTAAVPVLGKILEGLKILHAYRIALIAAVVGDILLWPLVGFLTTGSLRVAGNAAVGFTVMVIGAYFVLRPLLERLAHLPFFAKGKVSGLVAVVLCALLAWGGALVTERLGIHWVPGAFLAGVVTPHALWHRVEGLFKRVADVLIVPFFLGPGLTLSVSLLSWPVFVLSVLYILLAGGAKILSVYGFGRRVGYSHKRSLKMGFLLNTRGTVEMVVASTFASLGFLPDAVFAAVIAMTIVCTAITAPAVRAVWWLYPNPPEADLEGAKA